MEDDGVRERHGVGAANGGSVRIYEDEGVIVVTQMLDNKQLSPEAARYLGLKLLRLARRVEKRRG